MIPLIKPYIAPKDEMMPAIEQILYSGYIAEGEAVKTFERELMAYMENPNLICVNSGTASLHIALLLLNIGSGDEVISTALTAEPTNTTIAVTGAKVVWADIDEDTGLISPSSIRQKITERTKAIMVVHYGGMVCDMDAINAISREFNIPVIEDAAHALGSRYAGKHIGSNSKFTCFSFQAIKHLTTVDGGALAFRDNDPDEIEEAKRLRWFGLSRNVSRMDNNITRVGYKYNMNNVNATIGSVQMRHIESVVYTHKETGRYYDCALQNVPGVRLLRYYAHTEPSYWLYTICVEKRADFIRAMEQRGIMASPLHHRTDVNSAFAASRCELPALDRFDTEYVHIPCGWWVDAESREKIVDAIKKGW